MSNRFERCPELPAPPGRIAAFGILALASGIAVALWIDRPTGPQCTGILAARSTLVSATSAGTVAELTAREGDSVAIGAPLLTLQDESLQREVSAKRREIALLEAELARTVAQAELEINWRSRTLESEICDIQLKLAAYLKEKYDFEMQRSMLAEMVSGRRVAMADVPQALFDSVAGTEPLTQSQRMSAAVRLEAATNAAQVSSAQVEICELRQQRLETLIKDLPQKVRSTVGVDVAEANLERAREELTQLESREQGLTISSAAIGKVGLFHVRKGDRLTPGMPIVELLDDSQRYLVVDVPSQHITAFAIGDHLTVYFPGRVKRGGTIASIAPQAQARAGDPSADPTIRMHVEPAGALWPDVPIGTQVRVFPER